VYAVEATAMAVHARNLVAANGFADVIEVIQNSVEECELPEKVDIIVSEWMGYFLLRESMFDSVIKARDKFMKPGGAMYPSHAEMIIAPMTGEMQMEKLQAFNNSMNDWEQFKEEMEHTYGVSVAVLDDAYRKENYHYQMQTCAWSECAGGQVVATPAPVKAFDCHTVAVDELIQLPPAPFNFEFPEPATVHGFVGWFDVHFRGSSENPAPNPVTLSTAPEKGYTHWGQQVMVLNPPVHCSRGDAVVGSCEVTRQAINQRLLNVRISHHLVEPPLDGEPTGTTHEGQTTVYSLD